MEKNILIIGGGIALLYFFLNQNKKEVAEIIDPGTKPEPNYDAPPNECPFVKRKKRNGNCPSYQCSL